MIKKELITEQQARSIDIRKIELFLDSSICNRMLNSGKIYREVPFNIELSHNELYPDLFFDSHSGPSESTEDKILLQGVVDCYFEENDKIILIDYKTDYIQNGNTDEIKEKYKLQITYYSRALELLTGLNVNERYIYLFSTGELVEI